MHKAQRSRALFIDRLLRPSQPPLIMISSSFLLLACALTAAATRSVNVKVSAPDAVSDADAFDVSTTVTNTGDETLKLLKDPRSSLSSFATNTFVVTNSNGAHPAFIGAKVRYVAEAVAQSRDDSLFVVLVPGESVEIPHEGTRSVLLDECDSISDPPVLLSQSVAITTSPPPDLDPTRSSRSASSTSSRTTDRSAF